MRKNQARRAQHAGDIKLALEELTEDSASGKRSRALQAGGQATVTSEEQPSLMRKLFGSVGAKPYRLWEILHIKMCLRCALLVYLGTMAAKCSERGMGVLRPSGFRR